MRDKHAEQYKMLAARRDARRQRLRTPVSVFVPPWILDKIKKAKESGERVVLRQM